MNWIKRIQECEEKVMKCVICHGEEIEGKISRKQVELKEVGKVLMYGWIKRILESKLHHIRR